MKKIILVIGILLFSLSFNLGNSDCLDLDHDGFGEGCHFGIDCDDSDPEKWYWRPFYLDEDQDMYGVGEIRQFECWGDFEYSQYPLDEMAFNNLDCNDLNFDINPARIEICGNGVDEDCNGYDLPCSREKLAF